MTAHNMHILRSSLSSWSNIHIHQLMFAGGALMVLEDISVPHRVSNSQTMSAMDKLTDADYESATLDALEWIRSPRPSGPTTFSDWFVLRLGLWEYGLAIPQAREEEFVDALLHATDANRTAAVELVLHYACGRGSMRLVQFLLPEVGVDGTDANRATPLTVAARGGHVKIVEYLLAHAATELSIHVHWMMLKAAVDRGPIEMVEFLLALADRIIDVNVSFHVDQEQESWVCDSLLERAIRRNRVEVASALLGHGASGFYDTPEILESVSSVAMAEFLCIHGADYSGQVGLKIAMSAIDRGDTALCFFLLDRGVDIRRAPYTTKPLCVMGMRMHDRSMTEERLDFVGDLFTRAIDIDAPGIDGSTVL